MDKLRHSAIIVAAGKGLRMDLKTKKQYLHLGDIPILARTIMAFDTCDLVKEIILVVPKQEKAYCKIHIIDPYGFKKKIHLVEGGNKRQDSVLNGLKYIQDRLTCEKEAIVMIHDGVRPFVGQNMIKDCIRNAIENGGCVPGVKITDTVKHVDRDCFIQKTVNRENLYNVQTPQAFKLDLILRAFDHAEKTLFLGTDDASLVEHLGHKVLMIKGSKWNIKITTPEDLVLGKYLLTLKLS